MVKMIFKFLVVLALTFVCSVSAQNFEAMLREIRARHQENSFADGMCEGLGFDTPAFLANTRGCSWFHVCVNGVHTGQNRCPEGFHFNYGSQACALIGSFECTISNPDVEARCPDSRGLSIVPHPYSCSKFIICFDGIENDRDCEPGLHYSPYDERCVTPFLADCNIEAQVCRESEETGVATLIQNSRDCASFFVCIGSRSAELKCAPDTHFNPDFGWCDNSEEYDCEPSVPDDQPRIPDKIEIDCDGLSGVAIAHPDSCEFYFFCADDRSYLNVCGEGLAFDAETGRCQLQENSRCWREANPTEPPTDPPTDPPTEEPTEEPTDPPTEPPAPESIPGRFHRIRV